MTLGRFDHIFRAMPLLAITSLMASPSDATPSVVYQQRRFHSVTAHVVTVNLNDPHIRVSVATAARGIGHSESMRSFVQRLQPAAAITGTFFDTGTLLPVGDIFANGHKIYRGPAGTGFCVRDDNTVDFHARRYGRTYDWSDYETVLCAGPTLLHKGKPALHPRAEGYRDPALWALKPRTAVGRTRKNKLLLVSVTKPIYLSTMMSVMTKLGAVEAIGLDGGSSCALYAKGKAIVRPGRALTNVLYVYRSHKASKAVVARLDLQRRLIAERAKNKGIIPSLAETVSSSIAVMSGSH